MSHQPLPKAYLYRRIVQAKLFIDENYHLPLHLNNIANEAYFSKYHFIRLFKAAYGKTPHQHLIAARIAKAQLLLQNNLPVMGVCYAVGFDSVTSFTALFKKITGQTPSAYQRLQLQRAAEIVKIPLKFIPNCFAEQNGWTQNRNFE